MHFSTEKKHQACQGLSFWYETSYTNKVKVLREAQTRRKIAIVAFA